jgi:hypothetical protein
MDLFKSPRQELDPLDMEILERAFDAALAVVKEDHHTEFDSDEGLETIVCTENLNPDVVVMKSAKDRV